MRTNIWFMALLLLAGGPILSKEPATFTEAVIQKAVSFMPAEVKAKLTLLEADIVKASKPTPEPRYYVEKGEGNGATALADKFREARKKIGAKPADSALTSVLGGLAGTVIGLCQPYHTDPTAFTGPKHAEFEKALDAAAGKLKADFDGNKVVSNPSEFAVQIAKSANGWLTSEDEAAMQSAVFSLAANGVADCWWTLLVSEKTQSADSSKPIEGGFIGNKRSLKFHLPTCRYLPAEKNRVYFKTREEAIAEGYVPCKVCKP
jgi:hypothetical protein